MLTVSGTTVKDRYTQEPGTLLLVDPHTPSGVQPVGQASGWALTFSDEFTRTSLDRLKWDPWYPDTAFWNATSPGGHLTNTGEPEAYDPSAISFDGSSIMTFTYSNQSVVSGIPHKSGMVTSYPSFNQLYGYFEASIKMPTAAGMFPAFWMDPQDQSWPPELDIMESKSGTAVSSAAHWGTSSANHQYATNSSTFAATAISSGQFHTYGALWEAGRFRTFVDGVQVWDFQSANVAAKAMYLICNLAGDPQNFPAAGVMPFQMQVDYIRAWKAGS